jgi:hypothetical protein
MQKVRTVVKVGSKERLIGLTDQAQPQHACLLHTAPHTPYHRLGGPSLLRRFRVAMANLAATSSMLPALHLVISDFEEFA